MLASQLIFGPLQTYASYKVFAYLVLGRIEATLEQRQPEEQHGFRSGRRIEEHLLTANIVIDKTLLANVPLWIASLDLSKVQFLGSQQDVSTSRKKKRKQVEDTPACT